MDSTPDPDPDLVRRYGAAAPRAAVAGNEVISLLYRHRSVRRYTDEPVGDDIVTALIAAAQSAATSSNLQTWSVIEVREPARKDAVALLAGDQDFIRRAPVFLVFVADWARNRVIAERRGAPTGGIDFLESTLVGFVDAALAAQNAVVAAESLGLGVVYVGSVRNAPERLADLLGLPPGAFPVVGLAIGHPDPADPAGVKPRLPQSAVRHRESYALTDEADVAQYDGALTDYYATHGSARGWVEAVLDRVRDASSLHGRHTIGDALARRGLTTG